MPLHSIQPLPTGARLGLWQLRETAADLWPLLPDPAPYRPLLPAPAPAAAAATRQAQWLAARVLLHRLLAQPERPPGAIPTPSHLVNDGEGRPYLAGWPEAAVSLSHSGEWVAVLLAPGGRAGVDVELVRDKARRLAGRFLSAAELAAAQAPGADPAAFSLLWSAKETLYKLAGQRGLILRQDILTEPFPTPLAALNAGELAATLALAGGQSRHRVCYYQPAPGYVLTYCHAPVFPSFSLLSG